MNSFDEDVQLALALSLSLQDTLNSENTNKNVLVPKEIPDENFTGSTGHISVNKPLLKKVKLESDKFDKTHRKQNHGNIELAVENDAKWNAVQIGKKKRLRPKLDQAQIKALKWARLYIFSVICGEDKILDEHECTADFDVNQLSRVIKKCQISLSPKEVAEMLFLFNPNCTHEKPNLRLCRQCWEHSKQNNEVTPPTNCDWRQFCNIFDQCQLKVEKSGRVW